MFCENCGKKLPEGAVFCTNCGEKQIGISTPVQPVPAGQNPQTAERINIPPVQKAERPGYSQQSVQNGGGVDLISLGQYIIMFLIMAIPIAGLVMMFVWAFSSEVGPNKKNFARAMLVMMGIGIVLSIIVSIIMAAITAAMMSTLYY